MEGLEKQREIFVSQILTKKSSNHIFLKNIILGLCMLFLSIGGFAFGKLLPKRVSEGGNPTQVEAATKFTVTVNNLRTMFNNIRNIVDGKDLIEVSFVHHDRISDLINNANYHYRLYETSKYGTYTNSDKYLFYLCDVPASGTPKTGYRVAVIPLENYCIRMTSMDGLFSGYNKLTKVTFENTGIIDTSGCSYFNGLFRNCSSLEEVDLSGLDTSDSSAYFGSTSSYNNTDNIFYGCSSLKKIITPHKVNSKQLFLPRDSSNDGRWGKLGTSNIYSGTAVAWPANSTLGKMYDINYYDWDYNIDKKTYSGNNKSSLPSYYFYGQELGHLSAPTKTGYCAQWFSKHNEIIKKDLYFSKTTYGNKSCYAQWFVPVDFASDTAIAFDYLENFYQLSGAIYHSNSKESWSRWDDESRPYNSKIVGTDGKYHVYIYGVGNSSLTDEGSYPWKIESGTNVKITGNLKNLRDFRSADQGYISMDTGAYKKLFYDNTAIKDISGLVFDETNLSESAYESMFESCSNLVKGPTSLQATTLANGCYAYMFQNCYSLIDTPIFGNTTTAYECCYSMFANCYAIQKIPVLRAVDLATDCYYNMFYCTEYLKMYDERDGDYQKPYRIPISGSGSVGSGATYGFFNESNSPIESPNANQIYYLHKDIVVNGLNYYPIIINGLSPSDENKGILENWIWDSDDYQYITYYGWDTSLGVAAPAETIVLPNLTRVGYTFDGWKYDYGSYASLTNNTIAISSSGGISILATWSKCEYNISYILGTGATNGDNNPTSAQYGQDIVINPPERTGYTFAGWTISGCHGQWFYHSSTGEAGNFTDSSRRFYETDAVLMLNLSDIDEATVTLTANWNANKYTITLNPNGGFGGDSSVEVTYGQPMPSGVIAPTREGYNFKGYFSNWMWDSKQYYKANMSSANVWDITTDAFDGFTLNAQWEYTAGKFDVTQGSYFYSTDDIYDAFNNAMNLTSTSGNYVTINVKSDYALSSTITIESGKYIKLTSSGNYTLSRANNFTGNMFVNNGNFTVESNQGLTIKGLYENNNTTQCNSIILNNSGAILTIRGNITLSNNYGGNEGKGAAICNYGTLTIGSTSGNNNITISNNKAYYSASGIGGAIYNNGTATIYDCNIHSNISNSDSGIYNTSYGTLTINGGTFTCGDDSEKVIVNYGDLTIKSGTFSCGINRTNAIYHKGEISNSGLIINGNPTINGNIYIDNYDISSNETLRYIYVGSSVNLSALTQKPIQLDIDAERYGSKYPVVKFANSNTKNINIFTIAEDGDDTKIYKLYPANNNTELYTKWINDESYLNSSWKSVLSDNSIQLSDITKITFTDDLMVINEIIANNANYESEYDGLSIGATSANNQTAWVNDAESRCYDVKAFIDGTKMVVYSPVKIYAPEDCLSLFEGFVNCSQIDLANFNTSKTTDMSRMFYGCDSLNGSFGKEDSSISSGMKSVIITNDFITVSANNYVYNYSNMFTGTNLVEIDLSNFEIRSLASDTSMFADCTTIKTIKLPKTIGKAIVIPNYQRFVDYATGTDIIENVGSVYANKTIKDVGYKITLNYQNIKIYEELDVGFYLEYQHQNKMTSDSNNITIPTKNADSQYSYTFAGYFTSTDGQGDKIIDENGYINVDANKFSDNTTIYAYWPKTAQSYELKIYAYCDTKDSDIFSNKTLGGTVKIGSDGTEDKELSSNIAYGSNVSIYAIVNSDDGYEFKGWYSNLNVSGSPVSLDASYEFVMGTTSLTYYAKFALKKYTITFENDNHEELKSSEWKHGTIPSYSGTPEKQSDAQYSYTFEGWTPNIVSATQNATYTAVFNASIRTYDLNAKWIYDVSGNNQNIIDNNGNEILPSKIASSLSYDYSQIVYSQYTIKGYFISKIEVKIGDAVTQEINITQDENVTDQTQRSVDVTITGPTTVTFIYSPMTYRIIYVLDGEELSAQDNPNNPQTFKYNEGSETISGLQRENYSFDGWYLQTDYTGPKVTGIPANEYNSDQTLYAKWVQRFWIYYDCLTNGGTENHTFDIQQDKGSAVVLSYQAIKTGWEFVGWNTNKDATSGLTSLNVGTEDITLYAIYKKQINATFYSGMDKATVTQLENCYIYNNEENKTITIDKTITALGGWTAIGWRDDTDADDKEIEINAQVTISGGEKFYAVYSRTLTYKFDGNFDGNGEETGSANDKTAIQYYNTNGSTSAPKITLYGNDVFEKTGYHYEQWSKGTVLGTKYDTGINFDDFNPGVGSEDIELTFYAKWIANEYIVTFDKNADDDITVQIENLAEPFKVTYDQTYGTLPTATRDGYTFIGWFDSNDNQIESDSIVRIADNHTLYAHWDIEKYNITFYANTGNNENDSNASVTFGSSLPGISETLKPGFEFKGWSQTNDVNSENVFTTCPDFGNDGEDVELYAIWTAQQVGYKVLHYQEKVGIVGDPDENDNNHWDITEEDKQGEADSLVTPAVKTITGFVSPNAQTVTILGDGSLEVKYYYVREKYDVVLNKDDGIESVSGNGTYKYGEKTTISAILKVGYDFDGWYKNNASEYANPTVQKITIISSITLEARSIMHEYNITYINWGSSNNPNQTTYTVETSSFTLTNPARDGYTFTGWSSEDITILDNQHITILQGSHVDITLTANWEAKTYNIEYIYDSNVLSNQTPKQYTIESTDTLQKYVKPGLNFTGWKVDTAHGNWQADVLYTEGTSLTGMYGDVTLVAQGTEVELVFNGNNLNEATFNSSYNQTLSSATGGSDNITYTLLTDNSTLPEGLTFDASSLKISGTVTQDVGTYTFKIKAYDNVNEKESTATFTIKVNPKSVSAPTAKTGLIYNGSIQSAFNIANSEGYSLTNHSGKDAGGYTATAQLLSNYIWKDNTYTDKEISWSIASKELTITGVLATNRLVNGTNTVELTGGSLVGVCAGDNVSFELGQGTINQTASGKNLAVTTNITLDSISQNNYTLTQPNNIKVDISRIELTLENNDDADSLTKVYLEYNQTKLYAERIGGQVVALSHLTKETYTFQGYFTENTSGTKMIDENNQILFQTLENDTVFYAHWLKTSFRVYVASFSDTEENKKVFKNGTAGGMIIVEGENVERDEGNVYSRTLTDVSTINVKAVVKEGYEFVGWFDNAEFEGEPLYKDEELNINLQDEDITLYAQFKFIPKMSKWVKYGLIASAGIVFLMANVIVITKVAKTHKRRTRSKRFITDVDKFDKNDRFGGIDLDSLDF